MKNIFEELFDLFRKERSEKKIETAFVAREISVNVQSWDGDNKSKFTNMIKEVLSVIGIDVDLYVPHGSNNDPKKNDKINIFVWSARKGDRDKDKKTPETIWGYHVDCRDSGFLPTNAIENIIYDGDYAVAEIVNGNNLYIFYDVVHKGTDNEVKIFKMILEKFIEIISPETFKEILEKKTMEEEFQKELMSNRMSKYNKVMKKYYVNICSERFKSQIKDLEENVKSGSKKIKEIQATLIKKIQEIQEMEKHLIYLTSDKQEFTKELELEFDKLLQVPKVLSILTDPDGLVEVYTDTLYCTDPRTKIVHEIGKFKISISQSNGLRWENLTRRVDGYENNQMAPHIWGKGNACLGNMESVFPELIANYEYSIVAQLAIQFVESVNVEDSAGKHIDKWPVASS